MIKKTKLFFFYCLVVLPHISLATEQNVFFEKLKLVNKFKYNKILFSYKRTETYEPKYNIFNLSTFLTKDFLANTTDPIEYSLGLGVSLVKVSSGYLTSTEIGIKASMVSQISYLYSQTIKLCSSIEFSSTSSIITYPYIGITGTLVWKIIPKYELGTDLNFDYYFTSRKNLTVYSYGIGLSLIYSFD